MRTRTVVLAVSLAAAILAAWWVPRTFSSGPAPTRLNVTPIELAPICPWREPERDLRAFFPEASTCREETRILSGVRPALAKRLGRMPEAEENALRIHRVYADTRAVGSVLTRRVKGEHGAIELVVAVSEPGAVSGVRLQRLREPESIAQVLQEPAWLSAFAGKTAESRCRLGDDLPALPAEARLSGQALADGVRSLLVLLDTAKQQPVQPVR